MFPEGLSGKVNNFTFILYLKGFQCIKTSGSSSSHQNENNDLAMMYLYLLAKISQVVTGYMDLHMWHLAISASECYSYLSPS